MSRKNDIGEAVARQKAWRVWFRIIATAIVVACAGGLGWSIWWG